MRYDPSPIDTSHVDLTEDLRQFSELLAHNNHDVWAQHQKREGWTWGPVRNDERKEHPNLARRRPYL
jgi:ryanodine receptor 2